MEVGSFVHLGCVDLDEMGTVNEDEVPHHTVNMCHCYGRRAVPSLCCMASHIASLALVGLLCIVYPV